MSDITDPSPGARSPHTTRAVLFALMSACVGAAICLAFHALTGKIAGPQAWTTGVFGFISAGLIGLVIVRSKTVTMPFPGILSTFFVIYLNVAAILAFKSSPQIVQIVPYVLWFFPLALFDRTARFDGSRCWSAPIVVLGPLPIAAFVLVQMQSPLTVEDISILLSFLLGFYAFVLLVQFDARRRVAAAEAGATSHGAALRISEERFRLLSLATSDLVWDADLATGHVWWSDALRDKYGYDPVNDGSVKAWERMVHPADKDRVTSHLQAALDGGDESWSCEYRFVSIDGHVVEVLARGAIQRDASGAPVRLIGSTTDVTELRGLERRLRHAQKMDAMGQLTGGVAHDFNNLLTIIVGSAELLIDRTANDPKALQLAETALRAAERGAILTSRLLAFGRRQPLAPRRLDPARVMANLLGLINRSVAEGTQIAVVVADDVAAINVDSDQLENAILNLVINAREAMPQGGRLEIIARNVAVGPDEDGISAGDYVMIEVSDCGVGMSSDVAERAFEPFFTTKDAGRGSGLGLAMVWGFVNQSGGHAQIISAPEKGTSVRLYFPAVSGQNGAEAADPARAGDLERGTESILVVEDDDMVRSHVVGQLRGLGYTLREASSAPAALLIVDEGWPFDLLFSDIMMPGGMNGKDLADAVLLKRPGVKVLFTSGFSGDAIVHQGRLDPRMHLLDKPYRRADLAAKIREALDA